MENEISQEAWDMVQEAINKGYITIAAKRIQELSGVSLREAMEIVKYMKQDSLTQTAQTSQAHSVKDSQIASGDKLREYFYEAKNDPNNAVICSECRTPYPNRLTNCPGCGISRQKSVKQNGSLKYCETCRKSISIRAESCPHCGNPTGVHVCPKCNSINTRVITGTSKAASIFLWGAFAANKVVSKYECKDCGHKF